MKAERHTFKYHPIFSCASLRICYQWYHWLQHFL